MRPSRRSRDPFTVLGVPPGASRSEVRRAYRRRALAIHPDVAGGGDETTAAMAELNAARDHLLGAAVDRAGTEPPAPGDAPTPRPRQAPTAGADHAPAWEDHWSAWNDLPRRAR